MKKILLLTAILLILAGSFSCGKDDIDWSKIDLSNIENLYAQPLPVIQKAVQGKWKVVCTYGGISGITYHEDEYTEITENKVRGRSYIWKKYEVTLPGITPFQTYVTWDVESNEPDLYFGQIKNDSLTVNRVIFMGPDSYSGYLYVRVK
jgi:hypothetical protein